jgi:hypothetical protein
VTDYYTGSAEFPDCKIVYEITASAYGVEESQVTR